MNEPNGAIGQVVAAVFKHKQRVYGIALLACISITVLFLILVMSGKADSVFAELRSGLAGIGSTNTAVEQGDAETQSVLKQEEEQELHLTKPMSASETIQPDRNPEIIPTFDIVRVEPTGDAVIAGLSAPNNQIQIVSGDEIVAIANANENGEWALVLEQPFKPGGHQIGIRTVSSIGENSTLSEQLVTISVPKASAETAIVMLDSPGEPSAVWQSPAAKIRPPTEPSSDETLALESLPSTNVAPGEKDSTTLGSQVEPAQDPKVQTIEPTQAKELPGPENGLVTVEAIETESDGSLYASGVSEPKAVVQVYFDEELVGKTTTSSKGRWQLQTQHLLPQGSYKVRVDRLNGVTGQVEGRRIVPFNLHSLETAANNVATRQGTEIESELRKEVASGSQSARTQGVVEKTDAVIVEEGYNLWSISRRILGRGIRFTTLYSANKEQLRSPSIVFPGQVLIVPELESD